MAPALTAEPLSPKDKLTSNASPATGTRQSVRKLDNETSKKPTAAAKTLLTIKATTTRVTRSKDAAQQLSNSNSPNNRRKANSSNSIEPKPSDDQMGLSTAATHASSDSTAASSSSSSVTPQLPAAAVTVADVAHAEHNNNNNTCKDSSTTAEQLLANLTSNFEEAITAEICLRKTLPEVSISKEQPNVTSVTATVTEAETIQPVSMAEATSQLSNVDAVEETKSNTEVTLPQKPLDIQQQALLPTLASVVLEEQVQQDSLLAVAEIPDSLEERLSQLDGDINAAALVATVPLPTTPNRQQLQLQHAQELLVSPQHTAVRQSAALLTPQSTAGSSINFLRDSSTVLEDQDIEEVLKALKTFDGAHVNPDTICDFNIFNFLNNEEDVANVAATAAVLPATTEATILPEPSSHIEELVKIPSPTPKPRPLQECHAELEEERHVINRKLEFLLRRMRKFQARYMCRHVSDETAGVLEWSARSSHKAAPVAAPVRSTKLSDQQDTVMSIVAGRPGLSFWEEQTKQPLPATQMCNVLRHIDAVARKQQICHTIGSGSASLASSSAWYSSGTAQPGKRARKTQATAAVTATDASTAAAPRPDEIVPIYDNYVTSELTHVAGLLHTELREIQNAIDSDATESSSGGESADEMVNYNNSQQQSLPIERRAVWRYSQDRAAIALRWSWLCTQIADLEMKIRQHSDVYNDLGRAKGVVLLEETPAPKNGYKEQQPVPMEPEEIGADYLCSRARPLVLNEFRKRKLFQTTNMHTISKKVARPSSIKCGCQWPQVPCTLCTGRPDPTAPRDLPETMMPQNRVALLDAGYHPVLSFPIDVCQSLHLEAIGRQPDWQYRVMRSQAKAIVKSVWKAEREALAQAGGAAGNSTRRGAETTKRRYVRRKERNNNNRNNNKQPQQQQQLQKPQSGAGTAAVGLDSGNVNKTPHQPSDASSLNLNDTQHQQSLPYKHNPSLISSGGNSGTKKSRQSTSQSTQQPSGADGSLSTTDPRLQSAQNSRRTSAEARPAKVRQRPTVRRSRLIYDIDNIVIPHSIAAQTRVEILPYKEIPTPKWRKVDNEAENKQPSNEHKPKRLDMVDKVDKSAPKADELKPKDKDKSSTSKSAKKAKLELKTDVKLNGKLAEVLSNGVANGVGAKKQRAHDKNKRKHHEVAKENATESASAAEQNIPEEKVELVNGVELKKHRAHDKIKKKRKHHKVRKDTAKKLTTAAEHKISEDTIVFENSVKPKKHHAHGKNKKKRKHHKDAKETATEPTNVAEHKIPKEKVELANGVEPKKHRAHDKNKNKRKHKAAKDTATEPTTGSQQKIPEETAESAAKRPKLEDCSKLEKDCKSKDQKVVVPGGLAESKEKLDQKHVKPALAEGLEKVDQKSLKPSFSEGKKKVDQKAVKPPLAEDKEKVDHKAVKPALTESKEKVDQKDVKPAFSEGKEKMKQNDVKPASAEGKEKVEQKDVKPALADNKKKKSVKTALAEDKKNVDQKEVNAMCAESKEKVEEDISDEAYIVRHQLALEEEKRRFETFLKFPWTTRSRANRRTDSRAESSGAKSSEANTPGPASPATSSTSQLVGPAADNESLPSPLVQTAKMQHPLDALHPPVGHTVESVAGKRQERRRTTSSKLKEHERRSATPHRREIRQQANHEQSPFETLQFPLSDEVYQRLLTEMYAEPKVAAAPPPIKRVKSKSVSSNGGDGSSSNVPPASRRSSKAKATTSLSKLATSAVVKQNGGSVQGKMQQPPPVAKQLQNDDDEDDDNVDYDPAEFEQELLLEEDDEYHYLATPDDVQLLADNNDVDLSEQIGLDDDELGDDPFMDDDPNDPEWKRSIAVRSERIRKRV
ncbi:uncharacterized protein LOC108603263 isoform X2 [Drosophila busckii]|uniref:uncharacterized protein LOC108603263 isoform X2 n=1 Tax=Drosophila busckii TaxID=30019 RepID=UPI00083F3EC4|nr:uncharacterized protein LOC108603263 isoform X2 [Drosophila busckii]